MFRCLSPSLDSVSLPPRRMQHADFQPCGAPGVLGTFRACLVAGPVVERQPGGQLSPL